MLRYYKFIFIYNLKTKYSNQNFKLNNIEGRFKIFKILASFILQNNY